MDADFSDLLSLLSARRSRQRSIESRCGIDRDQLRIHATSRFELPAIGDAKSARGVRLAPRSSLGHHVVQILRLNGVSRIYRERREEESGKPVDGNGASAVLKG